jgi:hypothetical protein
VTSFACPGMIGRLEKSCLATTTHRAHPCIPVLCIADANIPEGLSSCKPRFRSFLASVIWAFSHLFACRISFMGWWPWSSAGSSVSAYERDSARKKCKSLHQALVNCNKANSPDDHKACRSLYVSLVECTSNILCTGYAKQHRECYVKLMGAAGNHQSIKACDIYVTMMEECLRKKNCKCSPSAGFE